MNLLNFSMTRRARRCAYIEREVIFIFWLLAMKVPFELFNDVKDRVAESADEDVKPGQVFRAALIGQVAAQHILTTSYHLRYPIWIRK
jgi:hypothetical protein